MSCDSHGCVMQKNHDGPHSTYLITLDGSDVIAEWIEEPPSLKWFWWVEWPNADS